MFEEDGHDDTKSRDLNARYSGGKTNTSEE